MFFTVKRWWSERKPPPHFRFFHPHTYSPIHYVTFDRKWCATARAIKGISPSLLKGISFTRFLPFAPECLGLFFFMSQHIIDLNTWKGLSLSAWFYRQFHALMSSHRENLGNHKWIYTALLWYTMVLHVFYYYYFKVHVLYSRCQCFTNLKQMTAKRF